jgi:CheY-like chemotaxis protein
MAGVLDPDSLLALLDGPAAWCDPAGAILAVNDAFEAWAGPTRGERVEIQGTRGALFLPDRPARTLAMSPLAMGGWLAIGASSEAPGAGGAVAAVVARRLERVELSLEANAQMGLLESPSEPVARCLRETLAVSEELRVLRRQVAALGAPATTEQAPVCLKSLVRDAIGALPTVHVHLPDFDGDFTVEADRARLFPVMVGLLYELAIATTPDTPLEAELRGGDQIRLRIRSSLLPRATTPAVDAAWRFTVAAGGRLLFEPGQALTLELPAFARGLRAGSGFGTVLVVDDDESTLAMMGAVLRRAGFRVLAAENGVSASLLLREHIREIVALVADAVLPGRSGIELAAEARRSVPHLPILLVTGHSSDLLGASDVDDLPILSKPFGARVLAERVRQLLDVGGS